MDLLKLDSLEKSHPNDEGAYLFKNVSASVVDHETIALLGVSGQGKSTLLRILGLLDVADQGQITLHGKSIQDWSPMEWRKSVSYVAQHAVMLPGNVEDNLRAVSHIHGTAFDLDLAGSLMRLIGLGEMNWSKSAAELSGGEKQRVALVRSLLLRPDILLLDEVTASLDQHSKRLVEDMLRTWQRKEGTTLIWVTHDLEQAGHIGDRVWFMAEGTLLEDCPTENFLSSPSTNAGKRFINQPILAGGK